MFNYIKTKYWNRKNNQIANKDIWLFYQCFIRLGIALLKIAKPK